MDNEAIIKLTKDLKAAVSTMTANEARFLVDSYYQMQENRLRAAGQIRSITKADAAEPHAVLGWLEDNASALEKQIANALKAYAESQPMGRWALEVMGIGPVIAAGLLAHIDITKCPTVGHIWAFAGLDPSKKWEKKTKRPWNAALKVVCFKAGESFIKLWNNPECPYGQMIKDRKVQEWRKNLNGDFAEQAKATLSAKAFKKGSNAAKWYGGEVSKDWAAKVIASGESFPEKVEEGPSHPMLPPAHIHARARRYGVKQFLADWHAAAYREHYKAEPPLPYPIAILGHAHLRKAA